LVVSSNSITWPTDGLGGHPTTVPVYLRNRTATAVSVGKAAVRGTFASDFAVLDDSCSGQTLPPNGACALFVSFTPSSRGPITARLEIPLGNVLVPIQLDGAVSVGTTSLVMQSQPGDWVGAGLTYHFTASNSSMDFNGNPSGLEADLSTPDGQFWWVDMFPGAGQVLGPGTYGNASRYPFNGTGNGLSVTGDSRGAIR
jgi:hypothetical protein